LLGETFFGYRGYFGQDSHGVNDCLSEIFMRTKNKEVVEKGARIKIKNSRQVKDVLQVEFEYLLESFQNSGFKVEIE
jgi:hypothetical protein